VTTKKALDPASARPPSATVSFSPEEQKLTTMEELWELLMRSPQGHTSTFLEVADFVSLFHSCKTTGLNLALAGAVPMHFRKQLEPENLSPGEVAHLCLLLIENSEMSEVEARMELDKVKDGCRENEREHPGPGALPDGHMNLKVFRRLLELVSALMRIDMDYIVLQMAWQKTGCFETTDTLAAHAMQVCARRRVRRVCPSPVNESNSAAGPSLESGDFVDSLFDRGFEGTAEAFASAMPDMRLLRQVFTMDDWTLFTYNGGLVDSQRRGGFSYEEMSTVYTRTLGKLSELVSSHGRRRKGHRKEAVAATAKMKGQNKATTDQGFVGRTEFEVLMEELAKVEAVAKVHKSALHLVVSMIQHASSVNRQPMGKTPPASRSTASPLPS